MRRVDFVDRDGTYTAILYRCQPGVDWSLGILAGGEAFVEAGGTARPAPSGDKMQDGTMQYGASGNKMHDGGGGK
jgi:hypothetical protein